MSQIIKNGKYTLVCNVEDNELGMVRSIFREYSISVKFYLYYTDTVILIDNWTQIITENSLFTSNKTVHTMENDISIDYRLNDYQLDISFNVTPPISFDRNLVFNKDTYRKFLKSEYNNYKIVNKSKLDLYNDKMIIKQYLDVFQNTRFIRPHIFTLGEVSGATYRIVTNKLRGHLKLIDKTIKTRTVEYLDNITTKRAGLEDNGYRIPDIGDTSTYNEFVDFNNPYSISYERWEMKGMPPIHGFKLS